MTGTVLFTGTANPALARLVSKHLDIPFGNAEVGTFSDGETFVELLENVRGREVYILQSVCPPKTNDYLMELLLMTDAARRASAKRIIAVLPYYGYARQDRRPIGQRVAISAKLVANLIQISGIDRLITVDLHADQIQGFFDRPLDNVYATPTLIDDIRKNDALSGPNVRVVSPDIGGVMRARSVAKRLGCELAIIDKRRPRHNVSEVINVIGDIHDCACILIDDIIDTAGTACQAAEALKSRGAASVYCYATHPVLSGPAVERISASSFSEVVVTDTIPLNAAATACQKIRQISVAPFLSEVIVRARNEDSVSRLFASLKEAV